MYDVFFCINREEFWAPQASLAPELKQLWLDIQMQAAG